MQSLREQRRSLRKSHWAAFVSTATLAAAISCTAAAQTAAPTTPATPEPSQADSNKLSEIVVPARRVEERLQDVPTSITAIGAKEADARRILTAADLSGATPNLVLRQTGATNFSVSIRGISTGGLTNQSLDSGLSIYLDGIYLGRGIQALADISDIARVEVLRGPQGTLFGRNVTGGAISFTTAEPTGQFGGKAEGTVGNYNQYRFKGSVNLPDWNGLDVRVGYVHNEHDGPWKNTAAGTVTNFLPSPTNAVTPLGGTVNIPEDLRHVVAQKTLGAEDTDAGTLALRYTGINHLTVDYKFDYTHEDYTQLPYFITGFSGFAPFIGPFGAFGYKLAPGSRSSAFPGYSSSQPASLAGLSNQVTMGHNLTVAYEITPSLTFKNILGYRTERQNQFLDNDGSSLLVTTPTSAGAPVPFVLSDTVAAHEQNQVSDEFQIFGKVAHLEWIVGGFYFQEHTFDQPVNLAFATLGSTTNRTFTDSAADYGATSPYGHNQTVSEAAYAHFTDHVTDRLDLAGGIRFSHDNKSEQLLGSCYFPSAAAGDPIAPLNNVPTNVSYCIKTKTKTLASGAVITRSSSAERNFSSTDWDLSLSYEIMPDVKTYVRGATGYESGGFINFYEYLPEKDTSYEVGLKSEFLNHTLRVNADAYTTRRDDAQQPRYYGTAVGSHIDNVTFDVRGFELETEYLPVHGLTLTASTGFADSHAYDGDRQSTPKWNLSLSQQYNFPRLGNGMYFSARSDQMWVDKIQSPQPILTFRGTTSFLGGTNDAASTIPAQWTVNASVSLMNIPLPAGYRGHLNLWSKNLLDDHHLNAASDFVTVVLGNWKYPRTFGLDFGVDF